MIPAAEFSSVGELRTFVELRKRAIEIGPRRVGVVLADDEVALAAMADALRSGIAFPVLIGDEKSTRTKAESLGLHELAAKAEFVSVHDGAAAHAVNGARRKYRYFDEGPPAHRPVAAPRVGQRTWTAQRRSAQRRGIF